MAEPTPWSGFRAQAGGGVLQLDPGVLEGLVNAANGTRVRVRSVRGQVGRIDNLARFADVLASADMLARRFSTKGQDFGRILDDHVRILDDLNETFMAAARTYIANEDRGNADFELLRQRIRDHRAPGLLDTLGPPPPPADLSTDNDRHTYYGGTRTPQPTWNEPGNRRPEENFGLPPGLVNQAGLQFDPQAGLHAEEPGSISYEQYRTIRDSILAGTPTRVAQAAADWRWLSGELRSSFHILTTQMAGTQGSWTSTDSGGAAERARQAVQAYGQGADTLMRNMNAIGDALEYTSEWLYTTGAGLASFVSEDPRIGEDMAAYNARVRRAALRHYTRVMNDTYVPGVEHTAQVMAVLPDPIPPVTGDRPTLTGSQGAGGQQGGYGGSGRQFSGGGAPGGGAPGAQTPEELAFLQQEGQAQGGPGDGQGGPGELGSGEYGDGAGGLTPEQRQALAAQQRPGGSQGGNPLEQLGQLGQQLGQVGQQLLGTEAGLPGGLAGIPALAGLADLQEQARKAGGGAGGGSGGGAGGGAGGGVPGERSAALDKASKLFPRATTLAADLGTARAGIAAGSGMPMSGMPMGGPMGGAGAQGGQEKDHKRAEYLDSTEHLEEAFGEAPVVVRPVVDQ